MRVEADGLAVQKTKTDYPNMAVNLPFQASSSVHTSRFRPQRG